MIEGTEILTSRGAVAAGPEEAARVGARIFEQGGNAMDAAAATSMACCMLQPQSTGVMGYVLCALVLDGRSGKVWSLDGNSIAPASASETMYDLMPMQDGPKGINENEFLCSVRTTPMCTDRGRWVRPE
jgi:gamma-glutamyltranspeptidase